MRWCDPFLLLFIIFYLFIILSVYFLSVRAFLAIQSDSRETETFCTHRDTRKISLQKSTFVAIAPGIPAADDHCLHKRRLINLRHWTTTTQCSVLFCFCSAFSSNLIKINSFSFIRSFPFLSFNSYSFIIFSFSFSLSLFLSLLSLSHTHTPIYIYIYIYVCVYFPLLYSLNYIVCYNYRDKWRRNGKYKKYKNKKGTEYYQ